MSRLTKSTFLAWVLSPVLAWGATPQYQVNLGNLVQGTTSRYIPPNGAMFTQPLGYNASTGYFFLLNVDPTGALNVNVLSGGGGSGGGGAITAAAGSNAWRTPNHQAAPQPHPPPSA
jgi:hypothetical protein